MSIAGRVLAIKASYQFSGNTALVTAMHLARRFTIVCEDDVCFLQASESAASHSTSHAAETMLFLQSSDCGSEEKDNCQRDRKSVV